MINNTNKPRQTWRQQLQVLTDWAAKHNAQVERKKELEAKYGR